MNSILILYSILNIFYKNTTQQHINVYLKDNAV